MAKKYICVGGKSDGLVVNIPEDRLFFNIPDPQKTLLPVQFSRPPVLTKGYTEYKVQKVTFHGKFAEILIPTGQSEEETDRLLAKLYDLERQS